jgi:hypothetical protein
MRHAKILYEIFYSEFSLDIIYIYGFRGIAVNLSKSLLEKLYIRIAKRSADKKSLTTEMP